MTSSNGPLSMGVHRPVGMLMIFCALVVFGLVSLGKLPFDLLPKIDFPSVTVRTTWEGAAPEDLEERVTERLEDALATVGGLARMRSSSRAESSEILLEFEWGSQLSNIVQDIRERIDRVFLPPGVSRPLILRYDPGLDPVMRLALSGDQDLVRVRDVAEQLLERELEGLTGVAAVKVRGGLEDEIQVLVDPTQLAAMDIAPETIRQRLQDENLNVPGGRLEEGAVEYVVRTLNEFESLEDIERMPLVQKNNVTVRLGDVATVRKSHKDRDVVLRVGGKEAVEVDLYREAGANLVSVADTVRERIYQTPKSSSESRRGMRGRSDPRAKLTQKSLVDELPDGFELTILSDQSQFVRGAISQVQEAALLGGLLAVLVCYLFLRRLAVTAIIGIAIPVSVVGTFGAMFVNKVSLNVMSLGGLALGIGMLVDNAIVVLESVTRCRDEGDPPLKAAVRGVREVGSAVTASTLTTIAVFAPIVFVEGVAGQVFGDQALAVVSSLLVSLAVALFLIPGLAARFEFGEGKREAKDLTPLLPRWRAFWGRGKGRWRILAKNVWNSPRFKLRATLSLASLALWLGLNGLKSSTLAPYVTQLAHGGWGIPEEITSKAALYGFLAFLFLIPFLWMLGGTFMRSIGAILADFSGLFGAAIHGVGGLVLIPLGIVLKPLSASVAWLQESLEDRYPRGLRRALQHPGRLLGIVGLICIITIQATTGLGKELLPEVKQGELTADIFYSTGMPLEETDWETARIERRIRDIQGVASTAAVAGADRESLSTEEDGPHVGRITLQIEESERRRELEVEVEANIRALLSQEAAIERFEIRRPTLLALKSLLEIEILCEDLETLGILNQEVQQKLHSLPGLVDLRSSIRPGSPEVRIHLDRQQLAQHNLDLSQVASRLRLAVEGEVSTNFSEFDERLDVRVRADSQHMGSLAHLKAMPVNPDAERPLPLEAVASFEMGIGPAEIRHVGSRRAAVLSANISGSEANLGTLSENIEAILAELKLPANTSLQLGGQKQEMDEALRSLQFALLLALFLVYAVMAAQFESLLQPLVILFSVPLAGIGAIWALRITGTSLSVVALLGAVVLAGIVVNNAIVLVDRINRNRDQGLDVHEAILQAGQARLRPILMTTFTTVLGMIPLTGWLAGLPLVGGIGGAEGTELRAPMALVVIAGLLTSTLLTLIVIPVVYFVVDRLAPRPETST